MQMYQQSIIITSSRSFTCPEDKSQVLYKKLGQTALHPSWLRPVQDVVSVKYKQKFILRGSVRVDCKYIDTIAQWWETRPRKDSSLRF